MSLKINLRKVHLRPTGKNSKAIYYIKSWLRNFVPHVLLAKEADRLLVNWEGRKDAPIIRDRVNYYNKLTKKVNLKGDSIKRVSDIPNAGSVYNRDTFEYLRYFDRNLKLSTEFGDNTLVPENPSLCKSRPISSENEHCVLLNMDKVRHFIFLKDKLSFSEKKNNGHFSWG